MGRQSLVSRRTLQHETYFANLHREISLNQHPVFMVGHRWRGIVRLLVNTVDRDDWRGVY